MRALPSTQFDSRLIVVRYAGTCFFRVMHTNRWESADIFACMHAYTTKRRQILTWTGYKSMN